MPCTILLLFAVSNVIRPMVVNLEKDVFCSECRENKLIVARDGCVVHTNR